MNNLNIEKIRGKLINKQELSYEELQNIFEGYLSLKVTDEDMTEVLKMICTYGLHENSVFSLVDIFIKSGDVLEENPNLIDKHSTGGVGDKTTLIVLPILASLGVKIAKMSGKALGYTGGTIDKLNSIGVKTDLTKEEFYNCLEKVGMVISSQTDNLCPMDKKIYALRDITGTTKSVPLIAVSIMSKKIASGAGKILLDVKVGKGALVDNIKDARALANLMIKIGKKYNREVVCMLTDMNTPLGSNIGNSLEVLEVIDILKNNKKCNLTYLCKEMASIMLTISKDYSKEEAMSLVESAITNGKAYDKFLEFITFQGGNLNINLPECEYILAKKEGYLTDIDSHQIGVISMKLGAGRDEKNGSIDYNAGIILGKSFNDSVKKGDVLAKLYGKSSEVLDEIYDAFHISLFKKPEPTIILEIIK